MKAEFKPPQKKKGEKKVLKKKKEKKERKKGRKKGEGIDYWRNYSHIFVERPQMSALVPMRRWNKMQKGKPAAEEGDSTNQIECYQHAY